MLARPYRAPWFPRWVFTVSCGLGSVGPLVVAHAQAAVSPVPPKDCSVLPATTDSIHVVAVAELRATGKTKSIPPAFASLVIETLRERLMPPSQLDLSVMTSPRSDWTHAVPYLGAHAYFTLRQGAAPEDIAFGSGTLNSRLSTALLAAIQGLHGDSLPPFPNGADHLSLEMKVETWLDTGDYTNGLFRATLPRYIVTQKPHLLGGKRPNYPRIAIAEGIEDSILTSFVIGVDGKVDESSIDAEQATYIDFVREMVRTLPKMRFAPMRIGDCPVEAFVAQPWTFTLNR